MIKRTIFTVLTVLTILSFAACSDTESEQTDAPVAQANETVADIAVSQDSDCCKDDEDSKDCCHEKTEESEIPDCCGG